MKKFITSLCLLVLLSINTNKLMAQCTFISPTVEINSIGTTSGGDCLLNVNLTFDIITNSGNKIIFLHLWKQTQYPSLNYGCNQCQPDATELSATLANFVIDNNNAVPTFLTTYGPANSVAVKTPTNNPGLTIQRLTSTTVGADKMVISNLTLIVPGACTSAFSFQGDSWSSNANSNNPVVHCAMAGFVIGGSDPSVAISRTCTSYKIDVTTVSATKNIYYDVRIDDGDGVYETTDPLVGTLPSSSAATVTPSSPFTTGTVTLSAPYNSAPYTTRKIFAAVSAVGDAFIGLTSSNIPPSCGIAPIILADFYAQRKNSGSVQLTWKTATEINAKGFDIERKTDNGFVKVGFVSATNNASGASYSYQDNNTSKGISQYRIKMVDQDNTYKLSETRSVKGNSTASDFTVFPNPSMGTTRVSITDINENTSVQIIDNNGRILKTIAVTNGNAIELNNLQKGIYLVRLVNKITGESITKKLTVLK